MKIRIKFRKSGVMRFIGHLDIMRFFQKAMRRAEIDIKYSEGFSPHQIMSFAAPLGVGIISKGEYLDIEVNSTKSSQEAMADLNAVMVDGIEIVDYVKLPDDAKKSMTIVAAADYTIYYKDEDKMPFDKFTIQDAIFQFYTDREEIIVTKQTKRSEIELDIKPFIYRFKSAIGPDGRTAFFMQLAAGSVQNIKPELVLENMYRFLGLEFDPLDIQIRRDEVYAQVDDAFVPLSSLGERIS